MQPDAIDQIIWFTEGALKCAFPVVAIIFAYLDFKNYE
jgi:hypothetical protein